MKNREAPDFAETLRVLTNLAQIDGELRARETAGMVERKRQLLAQLPEDVSAVYDALVRAGRHPVVAPLANGYCAGCHLRIPPQLANALTAAQELSRCPHCRRMIYDPRELAGPSAR